MLRVSSRIVARFSAGSLLSLQVTYSGSRHCSLYSCIVQQVEDLRKRLDLNLLMPLSTVNANLLLFDADIFNDMGLSPRNIRAACKLLELTHW